MPTEGSGGMMWRKGTVTMVVIFTEVRVTWEMASGSFLDSVR